MTDPQIAILMLGLFIFMVLFGFPIAFTLVAMGLGFGYYAYYDELRMATIFDNRIFDLMVQNTFSVMSNDVLVAVPLFLFMGYVVERANIVNRLFFSLQLAARHLPGSMAVAALATCAIFATATGIIGAVVTLMGMLALPAMLKAGYDNRFATGVICAGGCLGILIPPSIMLIVYAAIAELSPLRLYAAAIFPGFILAGMYMVYVVGRAMVNPELAPKPREEEVPPPLEIAYQVLTSVVPLAVLILAVLGCILLGLATPALSGGLLSLADMGTPQRVGLPDRQDLGHGLLAIRRFLDLRLGLFLSRWSRLDRGMDPRPFARHHRFPDPGSVHHLSFGLAAGVDGDPDHIRAHLLAHAGYLRRQPLFLCNAGRAQPADLFPDTAHGHGGLLLERGGSAAHSAHGNLPRHHALSGHRHPCHGADVSLPGDRSVVAGLLLRQGAAVTSRRRRRSMS
jgi:hypothetical protein